VNEQTKLSIFGALLDVPEGKSSEILIIEKGNIISKTYASPLKEGVTLEDRRTWVFEFMDRLMKKLGLQV